MEEKWISTRIGVLTAQGQSVCLSVCLSAAADKHLNTYREHLVPASEPAGLRRRFLLLLLLLLLLPLLAASDRRETLRPDSKRRRKRRKSCGALQGQRSRGDAEGFGAGGNPFASHPPKSRRRRGLRLDEGEREERAEGERRQEGGEGRRREGRAEGERGGNERGGREIERGVKYTPLR